MAYDTDGPKDLLLKLIGFIILLFVIWLLNGGPDQNKQDRGLLRNLLGTATSSREERLRGRDDPDDRSDSSTKRPSEAAEVSFASTGGAKEGRSRYEYVTLRASSGRRTLPVSITGWQVKSGTTGRYGIIGGGIEVPFASERATLSNITLKPSDRAIVFTGISPIGFSFRLNKCIGYLGQIYDDFHPPLPTNCPHPKDDTDALAAAGLSESCIKFISRMPRCEMVTKIPFDLGQACRKYITSTVNYGACVAKHRNDDDFLKDDWRIYIGLRSEIWKPKREIFYLIDNAGQIVDEVK